MSAEQGGGLELVAEPITHMGPMGTQGPWDLCGLAADLFRSPSRESIAAK